MDTSLDIKRALQGKRKGGILEHWAFIPAGHGKYSAIGVILQDVKWGNTASHGSTLRTSLVVNHYPDEHIIETLNSYYMLGKSRPVTLNRSRRKNK